MISGIYQGDIISRKVSEVTIHWDKAAIDTGSNVHNGTSKAI
jgi:hypothetical protein